MNRYTRNTVCLLCLFCLLTIFAGCTNTSSQSSDLPAASPSGIAPSLLDSPLSLSEEPSEKPSLSLPLHSVSQEETDPLPSEDTDDTVLTFSLENIAGSASRELTLPISIAHNSGIAGYSVTVVYDPEVLTFISCKNNIPGGFAVTNSTVKGKVRVMCTVMGGNKITLNDVCDVLTFKINEGAHVGSYTVGLILADEADSAYIVTDEGTTPAVECVLKGATLTVHC